MARIKAAGNPRAATRRRYWWQLRQRWRMLGVFEIDPEHEFHHLTSTMKEGLQSAIQATMDTPVLEDKLTVEQFKAVETETHQGFEMQTFAAPVFAKLRRCLDMTEQEYMTSLCSGGHYLQFVSNSKSKANFFVTNDKRFFLKTQSRREVQFLLSNLQAYVDHLEKNPHSLIVRFVGVHRIIIPAQIKKYFIVMQSVFYPDERINIRYDIKGCEVGRWTNPDTDGKQIIKVLKDNNFEGQFMTLGQDKSWFVAQVKLDVAFLKDLNVLDYSLLLAHQPLHRDEIRGKRSLANLVVRATKSLDMDVSPTETQPPPTFPLLEQQQQQVEDEGEDEGEGEGEGDTDSPDCGSGGIQLQDLSGSTTDSALQEFHDHHHRLLPDCKNAVHVIDGPDRRHYVGIIDIFTVYNWKKKLENVWKSLRFPGRAFSTVRPEKYSSRFCQWIQNHTK